ncbi:MAG: EamA family transporter [Eubacteriales bacterium]|nr:EamA family transporter [Eubacteriales bacterium]
MKKSFGLLYVIIGASLWGTLPIFSRLAYAAGSSAVTAAAMRAYLAALLSLAWLFARRSRWHLSIRAIPFYLVYGATGIGGTFLFYMMAIERLSTAMAVILLYTGPAFVILISRLAYGEPITRAKALALACTFAGSILVVRGYDPAALSASWSGILIGLASGLSYSMTTVLGRIAPQKNAPGVNASLMLVFGALVFLPLQPPWQIPLPSPALWLNYLALAILGSVLAYALYLKGLSTGLDGGIASLVATIEPVLATLLGALVFKDLLEPLQLLGMVIVLSGIVLPNLRLPGKSAVFSDPA